MNSIIVSEKFSLGQQNINSMPKTVGQSRKMMGMHDLARLMMCKHVYPDKRKLPQCMRTHSLIIPIL